MTTQQQDCKLLYAGFDTLEVSFLTKTNNKKQLEKFLNELDWAKIEAQQTDKPVTVQLPCGFVKAQVGKTGVSGGYAFTLDTGEDGFIVWLKNSVKEDWNVRIKAKSACLLSKGYEGTKKAMLQLVGNMGLFMVKESIARADFAMDFLAPDFEPDARDFVCHSRTTVTEHAPATAVIRGRKVESVTVGKMPNRQICTYNKSKEIKAKRKEYWWDVWGIVPQDGVWRIEVRAGKEALKDCDLRTFEQFEAQFQNYVANTLRNIRLHSAGQTDKTVTRQALHYVWQKAVDTAKSWVGWLAEVTGELSKRIIREKRERLKEILYGQIKGTFLSYAALSGVTLRNSYELLAEVAASIENSVVHSEGNVRQKFAKAKERYMFVKEETIKETMTYEQQLQQRGGPIYVRYLEHLDREAAASALRTNAA